MTANRPNAFSRPSGRPGHDYGEDAQSTLGINYTRPAQFRAVYHFNDNFQWARAGSNPQHFIGQGLSHFPAVFNRLCGEFDIRSRSVRATPNASGHHTQMAYDKKFRLQKFHWGRRR